MQTQVNHAGLRLVSQFECPAGEATVLPRPDRKSNQKRSVSLEIEDGFTVGRVLFVGAEVFVFIGNGTAAVDLRASRSVALCSEITTSLNSSGEVEVNNQHTEAIDYFYRRPSSAEMNSASKVRHMAMGYSPELISERIRAAQQRVYKLTALALGGIVLAGAGTGFVYKHTDTIGGFAEAIVEKTAEIESRFQYAASGE